MLMLFGAWALAFVVGLILYPGEPEKAVAVTLFCVAYTVLVGLFVGWVL